MQIQRESIFSKSNFDLESLKNFSFNYFSDTNDQMITETIDKKESIYNFEHLNSEERRNKHLLS